MELPQIPPLPFSEGGPPQSQFLPGDDARELIHEIRNLNQQVRLLHTVFVRRKVLFNYLVTEMVVIALVLATLFYLVTKEHSENVRLQTTLVGYCQVRNAQSSGTQELIARILNINQEQYNQLPINQITPFLRHIEEEYVSALRHWQRTIPPPINCQAFRP